MSRTFDDAITDLSQVTASTDLKVTLDLTTAEVPIISALRDLASPAPGLEVSIVHRPDLANKSESKFVQDLLAQIADRA